MTRMREFVVSQTGVSGLRFAKDSCRSLLCAKSAVEMQCKGGVVVCRCFCGGTKLTCGGGCLTVHVPGAGCNGKNGEGEDGKQQGLAEEIQLFHCSVGFIE